MTNECPLRVIAYASNPDHMEHLDDCSEDDCAWWDVQDKACSVLSIKDSLRVIAEAPALHEEG